MSPAPEDWPKSVTRWGSPPKAAMFLCTHRSAAMASSVPQLPVEPEPVVSRYRSASCPRKPSPPRR
eukprot:scaffold5568_cov75-Phaeocystis_antarctica.AAC.1